MRDCNNPACRFAHAGYGSSYISNSINGGISGMSAGGIG